MDRRLFLKSLGAMVGVGIASKVLPNYSNTEGVEPKKYPDTIVLDQRRKPFALYTYDTVQISPMTVHKW